MSNIETLLAQCRELGATFTPGPGDRLKIKAPAPLPEELREELRSRKAEVLALLQSSPAPSQEPPSWPCSLCGRPAEIEEVMPSLDGQRTLTLWRCEPCQAWGCTPDAIRQPPAWVSMKEQ